MIQYIKSLFKPKQVYIRVRTCTYGGIVGPAKYELRVNGLVVFVESTNALDAVKYLTGLKGKKKTIRPDYGIEPNQDYLITYIPI